MHNENAEKLKNFEDFSCFKKASFSIHMDKYENLAHGYSDSEIEYRKMCQFMHPQDFLDLKKQLQTPKPSLILRSLSFNNFESINTSQVNTSQIDKTQKTCVYAFPTPNLELAGIKKYQNVKDGPISNFSDAVQKLDTTKMQDVFEINKLDIGFLQKIKTPGTNENIVQGLNLDINQQDHLM